MSTTREGNKGCETERNSEREKERMSAAINCRGHKIIGVQSFALKIVTHAMPVYVLEQLHIMNLSVAVVFVCRWAYTVVIH